MTGVWRLSSWCPVVTVNWGHRPAVLPLLQRANLRYWYSCRRMNTAQGSPPVPRVLVKSLSSRHSSWYTNPAMLPLLQRASLKYCYSRRRANTASWDCLPCLRNWYSLRRADIVPAVLPLLQRASLPCLGNWYSLRRADTVPGIPVLQCSPSSREPASGTGTVANERTQPQEVAAHALRVQSSPSRHSPPPPPPFGQPCAPPPLESQPQC